MSLRYRVALGYGLMGLLLSAAFAAVTTFVADDYEEIFVAALLQGQADTYLDALAANPRATLPHSPVFSVYRESEAPPVFRKLRSGIHELDLARQLGAQQVAYGWVQKVSNLILNVNLVVEDAATGKTLRADSVDIRGNTDESWTRGLRYLLNERMFRE